MSLLCRFSFKGSSPAPLPYNKVSTSKAPHINFLEQPLYVKSSVFEFAHSVASWQLLIPFVKSKDKGRNPEKRSFSTSWDQKENPIPLAVISYYKI